MEGAGGNASGEEEGNGRRGMKTGAVNRLGW